MDNYSRYCLLASQRSSPIQDTIGAKWSWIPTSFALVLLISGTIFGVFLTRSIMKHYPAPDESLSKFESENKSNSLLEMIRLICAFGISEDSKTTLPVGCDKSLVFVSRSWWGALPLEKTVPLALPVPRVIIAHTATRTSLSKINSSDKTTVFNVAF